MGTAEGVFGSDGAAPKQPIFDTHVHYKEPAWAVYPPTVVIEMMARAGVTRTLVSSTPDLARIIAYDNAMQLFD